MTAPTIAATIAGIATLGIVAYAHWDILHSYEYPIHVPDTTPHRLSYSIHHRGLSYRNLLLLIGVPFTVGAVVYVFAVGLLEVFRF